MSRCCAVRALGRLNARDRKSKQGLIRLLRDPDADVRMDAAATLGRLRVAEATDPLIGNLEQDPVGDVRIEVVKALSRIGSKDTLEPLVRCFKADGYPELDQLAEDLGDGMGYGPWWEVQSQALSALGEIGDARATEPVIETLEQEDYEDLQESGFRVLARLNNKKAKAFLIEKLQTGKTLARRRAAQALAGLPELRGRGGELPAEFLNPLINALVDAEPSVRVAAARALGGSENPIAVVPLALLLTDADSEVRREVAALLGSMQGKRVLDRLQPLLADPDPHLKRRVAGVLGEIGDPTSVPPLSALLASEDEDLLYEIVCALGKIGRRGPEEELAEILANERRHPTVRVQAASALGRILANNSKAQRQGTRRKKAGKAASDGQPHSPEAVLKHALCDQDERVGYAALAALVQIDPKRAARRLTALLQGTPQKTKERKANKKPARESRKPSEARAQSTEELAPASTDLLAGQNAQTSTLAAIVTSQAKDASVAATTTEEPTALAVPSRLRILAARLLGDVSDPGPQAVRALREAAEAPEPALRREALLTLGRLGDKRGLPSVLKGLTAEKQETRLAALEALTGFRNVPGIGQRLAPLCDDPDPNVRARAVQALAVGRERGTAERLCAALQDDSLAVCRTALAALSRKHYTRKCAERTADLIFRFSGELRRGRRHIESAERRLGRVLAAGHAE